MMGELVQEGRGRGVVLVANVDQCDNWEGKKRWTEWHRLLDEMNEKTEEKKLKPLKNISKITDFLIIK